MRIRSNFTRAIERQISEAVAINCEKRKGTKLLNSKGEYNRCTIPRLSTKSKKFIIGEKEEDDAMEKLFQSKIREMKSEKRIRKLENIIEKEKEKQPLNKKIRNALIEISNENVVMWRNRRDAELRIREKLEKEDAEKVEKSKRVALAQKKRKLWLEKMKRKGKVSLEKKDSEWIKMKQSYWRNYRESGGGENDEKLELTKKNDENDEIVKKETEEPKKKGTLSEIKFGRKRVKV